MKLPFPSNYYYYHYYYYCYGCCCCCCYCHYYFQLMFIQPFTPDLPKEEPLGIADARFLLAGSASCHTSNSVKTLNGSPVLS